MPHLAQALGLALLIAACAVADPMTLQQHQEAGMKALQAGEFSGALEHYHAACDMAPQEYMNFMRRATVYRAMGRTRQAVKDYTNVLQLKADFAQARAQRAELLLKQGDFDEAVADYTQLGDDPKYAGPRGTAEAAKVQFQNLLTFVAAGDHPRVIEVANAIVEAAPNFDKVRMLRAAAYEATGQNGEAIGDYMRAAKLTSGETEPYVRLSTLYYKMGERNEALGQVRECVRLDEEEKTCWALYKKLKKLTKILDDLQGNLDGGRYPQALENIEAARKIEKSEPFYVRYLAVKECVSLANGGKAKEAIEACTQSFQADDHNTEILEHRAKAHEVLGDFAKAVEDLQKAVGLDEGNQHLKEALARAQKLLKNSLKRDYYKILGLPRNADDKAINNAYRKLAREWHPDKFAGEEEKEKAAKKFMDIADAKEVLMDAEKRRQFDNGDDPLDAQEQSQRQQQGHYGFNPFGGGFGGGGFGGGGQQFHFRFQ